MATTTRHPEWPATTNHPKGTRMSVQTTPSVGRAKTKYHLVHESTSQGYTAWWYWTTERNYVLQPNESAPRPSNSLLRVRRRRYIARSHRVRLSRVTGLTLVPYTRGDGCSTVWLHGCRQKTARRSNDTNVDYKRNVHDGSFGIRVVRTRISKVFDSLISSKHSRGCVRTLCLSVVFDFSKMQFLNVFKPQFPYSESTTILN